MQPAQPASADERMDLAMGRLLQTGVIIASVLMLAGGVMFLMQHGSDVPQYKHFHPSRQRGLLEAGVLVMLATPILRVLFAAFAFAREHDWLYVGISLTVLALLVAGILLGH